MKNDRDADGNKKPGQKPAYGALRRSRAIHRPETQCPETMLGLSGHFTWKKLE